jgi:hypothetical protein
MAGSYSYATKLGVDSADPVTKRFDFQRESLVQLIEHRDTNGLRGTRSHSVERNLESLKRVGGQLILQPNVVELGLLLPWIFGAAGSGSGTVTYALAETIPTRYVTIDRVAKVFTYAGVGVDTATFRASQGEPLELELDCIGQTETVGNSGTFPAIDIDLTTKPWMFHNLALSIAATTYNTRDFSLTVSNFIDRERFFNSQTLTAVNAMDREITISATLPYGDASAVYTSGMAAGGVAAVATFTNSDSDVLTFTIVKAAAPSLSPVVEGPRSEVFLRWNAVCFKSSTTEPLVTVITS